MLFFYHIKNDQLRELVMASESILTQSEEAAQNMINQIAMLPEDGQKQMIGMLEDEQKKIMAKRSAVTPKKELMTLEDDNLKITALSHEFDKEVRETQETEEHVATEAAAESLIKNI